ncbi:MAG: hypothetical protein ACREQE_10760, partial [Candidatus Binataceae bacterium]
WRMLRVLDAGRPIPVSENIIWRVLNDIKLPLPMTSVRRELDYLRKLGLAEIEDEDGENWYAKLTARGVDVVEYTVAAPPGVGRPRKYW